MVVLTIRAAASGNILCTITDTEISALDTWGIGRVSLRECKKLIVDKTGIDLKEICLLLDARLLAARGAIDYKKHGQENGCDISLMLVRRTLTPLQRLFLDDVECGKLSLQNVSKEACADESIVTAAVQNNVYELQYASRALKRNKTIVLTAVQHHGFALQFADPKLRDNDEVVLAAVKRTGMSLRFASMRLRRNRAIVKAAVRADGMHVLHFACRGLQVEMFSLAARVMEGWYVHAYDISDGGDGDDDLCACPA